MDRPVVRDLIPIERVWARLEAVEAGLRRATTSDRPLPDPHRPAPARRRREALSAPARPGGRRTGRVPRRRPGRRRGGGGTGAPRQPVPRRRHRRGRQPTRGGVGERQLVEHRGHPGRGLPPRPGQRDGRPPRGRGGHPAGPHLRRPLRGPDPRTAVGGEHRAGHGGLLPGRRPQDGQPHPHLGPAGRHGRRGGAGARSTRSAAGPTRWEWPSRSPTTSSTWWPPRSSWASRPAPTWARAPSPCPSSTPSEGAEGAEVRRLLAGGRPYSPEAVGRGDRPGPLRRARGAGPGGGPGPHRRRRRRPRGPARRARWPGCCTPSGTT